MIEHHSETAITTPLFHKTKGQRKASVEYWATFNHPCHDCSVFQPAGTLYFHEGMFFNPLAFALAEDALVNEGPGNLSRIDVGKECQKIVPDGLSLIDVLVTEVTIPLNSM